MMSVISKGKKLRRAARAAMTSSCEGLYGAGGCGIGGDSGARSKPGGKRGEYLGPEGTLGGPKLELEGVRGRGVCGLERSRCGLEDGTR